MYMLHVQSSYAKTLLVFPQYGSTVRKFVLGQKMEEGDDTVSKLYAEEEEDSERTASGDAVGAGDAAMEAEEIVSATEEQVIEVVTAAVTVDCGTVEGRADGVKDVSKTSKSAKRKGCLEIADGDAVAKKPKKKNIWSKTSSRKSYKKNNSKAQAKNMENENLVYINPVMRNMEKVEDGPHLPILLSKIHKAEKVELGPDLLTAGSVKGYRMVRATRGVVEGAWYFEIIVTHLGDSGHTRLGWCTHKGDVQAPVGYDAYGYSYRDLQGCKIHAALREEYGEDYSQGDTIGFYISLPNGAPYAPKPPEISNFKGLPYITETKEEPLKPVPGSEISFFKNGICQGVAYKDIYGGRYFPAASMYTLPNEKPCTVRFNFGPDFECQPSDWGDRPTPRAMSSAPFFSPDTQAGQVLEVKENVQITAVATTSTAAGDGEWGGDPDDGCTKAESGKKSNFKPPKSAPLVIKDVRCNASRKVKQQPQQQQQQQQQQQPMNESIDVAIESCEIIGAVELEL